MSYIKGFIGIALLVFALAAHGFSATYTVINTTDDATPTNCISGCSLRQAINRANQTGAADNIVFDPAVTGVINITGQLQVTSTINITGPGARILAVDAGGSSRILDITSTGSLALINITLRNGSAGSASRGGGIQNLGNCLLTNVAIAGNIAGLGGGGIHTEGTLTVDNSTISGNSTTDANGAGSGINIVATVVTVRNSTISGNTSAAGTNNLGGGIAVSSGSVSGTPTVSLINVTITNNSAGNGGGVFLMSISNFTTRNTVIANNTSTAPGSHADVDSSSQTLTSSGNNLVRDPKPGIGFTNGVNGDIVGLDPLLGPLANSGGPTDTHMLLINSPAIDAGNDCVVLGTCGVIIFNDQRGTGFSRLEQAHVDIGAYEIAAPSAAGVAISGRVSNGLRAITGARLTLTEHDGTTHQAISNAFGYFIFEDIEAGQNVVIETYAKGFTFEPRFIQIADEVTGLEIIAEPSFVRAAPTDRKLSIDR